MTDKVSLIKAEIERLKDNLIRGACSSQVAMETRCKEEAYNEVLAILEQEEPVSIWHDMSEEAENGRDIIIIDPKDFYGAVLRKGGSQLRNHNKERYVKWAYIDDIINVTNKEEPVSEELEEASLEYFKQALKDGDKTKLDAFKAGAKWQKEKDESTTEDLGEYINELFKQFPEVSFAKLSRIAVRVAKWQKEKEYTCYEEAFEDGATWKKEKIMKTLLSEVLPCFMHGGEADEVVAKLDEVLNQKK